MTRWVVLALVASGCSGGVPIADFQATALAAKACDASRGETCRLAGSAQCLCPTAVNAVRAQEIDDLAEQVACGGAQVECATATNPRCVGGTCVADLK